MEKEARMINMPIVDKKTAMRWMWKILIPGSFFAVSMCIYIICLCELWFRMEFKMIALILISMTGMHISFILLMFTRQELEQFKRDLR